MTEWWSNNNIPYTVVFHHILVILFFIKMFPFIHNVSKKQKPNKNNIVWSGLSQRENEKWDNLTPDHENFSMLYAVIPQNMFLWDQMNRNRIHYLNNNFHLSNTWWVYIYEKYCADAPRNTVIKRKHALVSGGFAAYWLDILILFSSVSVITVLVIQFIQSWISYPYLDS